MPLFTIITGLWYRRVEQPIRVALWYSMNGTSTMVASAISYGLGHVKSSVLSEWQMFDSRFISMYGCLLNVG